MLDLTQLKQVLFEIKLFDETVLQIKKPTQGMLNQLLKMEQYINGKGKKDNLKIIDEIYSFITMVFNQNINDRTFTKKEIEEMFTAEVAMLVIEGYLQFSYGLISEKN
jgi:hypothetical protein